MTRLIIKSSQNNFNSGDGIPGVFTLGQDNIEKQNRIKDLNKKIEDKEKEIYKNQNNIEERMEERKKLCSDFKEDAWQKILKDNEENFKNAFIGFMGSKDSFFKELIRRIEDGKGELLKEDTLLERYASIFNSKPEKLELLYELPENLEYINKIINDEIWTEVIKGKEDVGISDLINKLDNESWIREGIKFLDKTKNICPFCQKETIDENFKKQIEEYFDVDYKEKIESMKSSERELKKQICQVIRNFKKNTKKSKACEIGKLDIDSYNLLINKLESDFEVIKNKIESKIHEPNKKIHLDNLTDSLGKINDLLKQANEKINTNNKIVEDYKEQKKKLIDDIWCYCIKKESESIKRYVKKKGKLDKALKGLNNSLEKGESQNKKLKEELNEETKNISSAEPVIKKINEDLKRYGFDNFYIEPYRHNTEEEVTKYRLKRNDDTYVEGTLSEGEATFITFLYFMQLVNGSKEKGKINEKKILVIDDPISSLDSNILYFVSLMIVDLIDNIKKGESDVKQLFVFTHNVYFHREITYIKGGNKNDKKINYWIIRKNNNISKIENCHQKNPINSTYELLWRELKEDENLSSVNMQNIMRRIIENYFHILGSNPYEELISKFKDKAEKLICRSLFHWMNSGSHGIYNDMNISPHTDNSEYYRKVFKEIFKKTGNLAHYNMMMGIDNEE